MDPYAVLGVDRDADISAIRSSHRKFVLKLHPDRIRDEVDQPRAKDEFQKVQEAYELLSYPTLRAEYDNRVKLARLRKEVMENGPAATTAPHPLHASATANHGHRDERAYERRAQSSSYFEEGYSYLEAGPRRSSRKCDGYERKPPADKDQQEKKSTKWREKTTDYLPSNLALKFKAKCAKTKEAVKGKTRDWDRRREHMKRQTMGAYMEGDSSSDSDTLTYVMSSRRPGHASRPENLPLLTRKTESKRDVAVPARGSNLKYADCEAPDGRQSPFSRDRDREMPSMSRSQTMPRQRSTPGPRLKRSETHNSGTGDSRGRGFWGSDPDSPRQTRHRASSICSNASSRNGSLRGHDRFDSSYQRPTYSRPRADSAGSAGSAGSRYDIDRSSPGLPPMPRRRPTSFQIVEGEDDLSSILVNPVDRHRRTGSPSPPLRERDRRHRPERPTISTRTDGEARAHVSRRASAPVPRQTRLPPLGLRAHGVEVPLTRVWSPPLEPLPRESSVQHTGKSEKIECDVCGLEIAVGRKRDWQKHIFEDLRPYQCLETGCKSASETYPTCMKLLAHMKEQHPKSELLNAKELACPFCQEDMPRKRLQRLKHVGGHMEEIALTAITRAYEDWTFYSDSEKYLSSVCDDRQQQDKKLPETSDFPPARSGLPSAPTGSTVGQTEVRVSVPIAKEASKVEKASQPGPKDLVGWYDVPILAAKKQKMSREARRVHEEPKSAKVQAPSSQHSANGHMPLPQSAPPKSDGDRTSAHNSGRGWGKKQLTLSSQKLDNHTPPSQPRAMTMAAEKDVEVAVTNNKPSMTIAQASRTADPAGNGGVLEAIDTTTPQPRVNSTRSSEQTDGAQAKKDRPRVTRTGGARSWGDWATSPSPRKAKKISAS